MVFKKHLTPLSRAGRIVKHAGKGSTMQRPAPGEREDLTGGDPRARMMNRYPTAPQPPAPPTGAPPLGGPSLGPAAPVGPPRPDDAA